MIKYIIKTYTYEDKEYVLSKLPSYNVESIVNIPSYKGIMFNCHPDNIQQIKDGLSGKFATLDIYVEVKFTHNV